MLSEIFFPLLGYNQAFLLEDSKQGGRGWPSILEVEHAGERLAGLMGQ